jgi:hypothetical protein
MTHPSKHAFPVQVVFLSLALAAIGCTQQPDPSPSTSPEIHAGGLVELATFDLPESWLDMRVLYDPKREVICYFIAGESTRGPALSCFPRRELGLKASSELLESGQNDGR